MALFLVLHVLGAVIWVGGMFFAYLVLRPAAGALDPAVRFPLWQGVLARFFAWVWASAVAQLVTGFAMVLVFYGLGGLAAMPAHVHLMMAVGLVMAAIFISVFLIPWRRYRAAVAAHDWQGSGHHLNWIRRLVAANLVLGLAVVAVAAGGRYL
ncbi:MAG: CopD family protein [Burkholderiaceae bacterium]|nr:CopD family protein [Burkholderiaceae bacterium]